MTVLEARDLVKEFRRGRRTLRQRVTRVPDSREVFRAVDGISLRLARGEVLGLLGSNGAGKSTLVRMLASLLIPTDGSVSIGGVDAVARPRQARRHLGVMLAGDRSVYWKLTGRENLEYFAAMHLLRRARAKERIDEVLAAVELTRSADEYVERYSTGMRQRLCLARAIVHDPAVVLLDEPTSGLDPAASASFQQIVRGLRARGRGVLLVTHDLAEAEQLCDRIVMVDRGRIVFEGTVPEARELVPGGEVVLVELDLTDQSGDVDGWLAGIGADSYVQRDGSTVQARVYSDKPREVMADLTERLRVRRAEVLPVSLSDVFFSVVGERRR